MKKISSLFIVLLLYFLLGQTVANAHPGRTDSNGGHTCRTNCSQWGLSTGEYHYHNGTSTNESSNSESSQEESSTSESWDKDCDDFSSYEELIEYWNSKGYSSTNDPERLDGWGNVVDDGIPCEAPSDYDTTRINNSSAQQAEIKEKQDIAIGEKEGYISGLSDGQKGNSYNYSLNGSSGYQTGYIAGYSKGYDKGNEQFEKQKITATKDGYDLGKKQDDYSIPERYLSTKALESAYKDGFNKAIIEKDEKKKKEYFSQGMKDGKADELKELKEKKDIFIEAYQEGYAKGQEELKEKYIKQGYEAAFTMVKYKEPNLKKEKYLDWYKEGFKSNTQVEEIANLAHESGLDGDEYKVQPKYEKAETIYKYHYQLGAMELKEKRLTIGGVIGLVGIAGWLGRRFYVVRKKLK